MTDSLRAQLALALAGFTCFALLYGTQPILPQLTDEFGVSPATASLTVAAGTAAMAILLIPLSLFADRYGRERLMRWGLAGAGAFAFGTALAPDFLLLFLCRIGLGACIAGVPAAAMAYLGDEIPPERRARAMGLYIAANALGGMSGRFIVAGVTEWLDWRYGLATLGVIGTASAIVFWRMLPPARHFTPRSMQPRALADDLRAIASDPGLPKLFGVGFLVLGIFVGAYNYLGFRLSQPPYGLGPGAIGAIFALYAIGSASSAWTGYAMGRLGRSRILLGAAFAMGAGLLVTLAAPLAVVILGLSIFTIGFFAVHTVASAWVGRRGGARRGLVSALYLSGYYLGASVIGSAAGWPWSTAGWPGVVAVLLSCTAVLVAISLSLRRLAED
jgi:MFS transporter, YNFM family, putative membrane transport protein